MHKKTKLFISHSYSDKDSTKEKLIHDLRMLHNVEIWFPDQEMPAGDRIIPKLEKAINHCDYFIQIVNGKNGLWTNMELQLAFASEVRTQTVKVIKVILDSSDAYPSLIGKGAFGVVINFTDDYPKSFRLLQSFIEINPSDRLVTFDLDKFQSTPPIIIVANEVNEKLIDHLAKNPEQLKTIERRLFEEVVAEIFHEFGYLVELTQKTRDGGRDIIAIKHQETHLKYLIECKRPDPGNRIGIRPVRELFGVKQDEKATKAILATTSYFTKDALQFFERNKWELEPIDFNGLLGWVAAYKTIKKT